MENCIMKRLYYEKIFFFFKICFSRLAAGLGAKPHPAAPLPVCVSRLNEPRWDLTHWIFPNFKCGYISEGVWNNYILLLSSHTREERWALSGIQIVVHSSRISWPEDNNNRWSSVPFPSLGPLSVSYATDVAMEDGPFNPPYLSTYLALFPGDKLWRRLRRRV
jgi:hypothetical protein